MTAPRPEAADVVAWLAEDYGLGRGHAMALWHVISKGPGISTKHVGTDGVHRDASDTLWLDGKASRPAV
ncbi:valyl-tRNA synthetase [Actinotalea ferrariae CF5-4]|uniref:Valyl-tRNA synthetase n=1 Tax=Actinotalea ferrariae CF5-4 TaxID=948458 RepID=A0A021VU19_9CELL|nr:valyl-tRNA synthetase [Actinotalea ferrariae CF5-4]